MNLPLKASQNKDKQTFLMKVDSKRAKKVPFDGEASFTNKSSQHEDSMIRTLTSPGRSQFEKRPSPLKEQQFKNLIDAEVIDSVLEPIDGIEDLIKETPQQKLLRQQLNTTGKKTSIKGRAKLREVMLNIG